jgi:hypothetical protein
MFLNKLKERWSRNIVGLTMLCLKGSEEIELAGSQRHNEILLESSNRRQ